MTPFIFLCKCFRQMVEKESLQCYFVYFTDNCNRTYLSVVNRKSHSNDNELNGFHQRIFIVFYFRDGDFSALS